MTHVRGLAIVVALVTSASALVACNRSDSAAQAQARAEAPNQNAATNCKPLQTRPPNAEGQQPAFAGQTRACAVTSPVAIDVTVVAKGLDHPWAVEPLEGGDLLVTERGGRMRIVTAGGQVGNPLEGLPRVLGRGQGGLLDVALAPDFASTRLIYWSFTEPREDGNGTSVARGTLSADRARIENAQVIFRAMPSYSNAMHFGSRLTFAKDGTLFVTLGERSDAPMRKHSQQLDSHLGTIVRINADGSAPRDNPFVGKAGALAEIWTLGHRNVQSAALDAQGRFWIIEHGPQGGDELNLIEKGKNYGWPIVTYGEEYSGKPIAGAVTSKEGFEQPVYYWDPVIAPSGAQFYTHDAVPAWRNNLFVGSLTENALVRLTIENNRVTGEEHLLADRKQRVRDVRMGPDGALYVVTDEDNGELWKVTAKR